MFADLHVHSKYSSHALYFKDEKVKGKLLEKYNEEDFCPEEPTLLQHVLIDGTSHVKNILLVAKRRNIKCIAITDHNTILGSLEAQKLSKQFGIIVVPGMELSTQQGEILCYGITKKIEKGLPLQEALDQVHDQGGIAVVAHPFNPKHPNVDYARIDEDVFTKLNIDGMEVFNPMRGRVEAHFLDLAKQMKVGITGGSDAHIHYQIGKGLTILPDDCKDYTDVINAIKNRETYVTGFRLNPIRMFLDLLWVQTLGRLFINRKWGEAD